MKILACHISEKGLISKKNMGTSLVAQMVKNLPETQETQVCLIPGWAKSPGERNGYPLQYSCLENPMDRSLAGYSPWSRKESDTAEVTAYVQSRHLDVQSHQD